MELEDIKGHFWTMKEEMENTNARIDEWEERVMELSKAVKKLSGIVYKQSQSPSKKIANRHLRRIERLRTHLKGHCKGVWANYLPALDAWKENNHPDWSYHDLYLEVQNLRTWELDELSAIMGVEDD